MTNGVSWIDWVSLGGVVLTAAGVYLTWLQASAAKSAAEAAVEAANVTENQLRANQLLVLIPQLRWMASELDAAISDNDPKLTRRQLDNWRGLAAHVHGILKNESVDARVLRQLNVSVGLATSANTELMSGRLPVYDACRLARESVAAACNQLATWAGENASRAMTTKEEVIRA